MQDHLGVWQKALGASIISSLVSAPKTASPCLCNAAESCSPNYYVQRKYMQPENRNASLMTQWSRRQSQTPSTFFCFLPTIKYTLERAKVQALSVCLVEGSRDGDRESLCSFFFTITGSCCSQRYCRLV